MCRAIGNCQTPQLHKLQQLEPDLGWPVHRFSLKSWQAWWTAKSFKRHFPAAATKFWTWQCCLLTSGCSQCPAKHVERRLDSEGTFLLNLLRLQLLLACIRANKCATGQQCSLQQMTRFSRWYLHCQNPSKLDA